ncbi:hypothetical protein RDI58_029139 [Solanum bulbocastanum]|uniref:PPIase cyclophilin-type domain-containing protein n=1 Tax=Solanum bulbocastanum TaxID=147425 RepID=A0AAN8SRB8_SOLBU
MASAGTGEKNRNASQFYITLLDNLNSLDGEHTIFGEITKGFDTLNRINEAYLADLIPDSSPKRMPKDDIDDDVEASTMASAVRAVGGDSVLDNSFAREIVSSIARRIRTAQLSGRELQVIPTLYLKRN